MTLFFCSRQQFHDGLDKQNWLFADGDCNYVAFSVQTFIYVKSFTYEQDVIK